MKIPLKLLISIFFISVFSFSNAQFIDDFEDTLKIDPTALNGWTFFSGDGNVSMNFVKKDGYASIYVDATKDKMGIW